MVRVGDIGGKVTLGDFLPVDEKVIKAKPGQKDLARGILLLNGKCLAEQWRGNVVLVGGALPALADKIFGEIHEKPPYRGGASKSGRRKVKLTASAESPDNKIKAATPMITGGGGEYQFIF